ncbi:hypothetical protein BVC71_12265 [Marivivens niveibacter]|uniref:DUF5333 domain-containing protein n=2 Tax=Marivivens niveibacter TaxID=1930667 RepID=A0A251WWP7_9RHOB|nr:hypothetical protein BVC71_12265 [Marivivens niveibacter]
MTTFAVLIAGASSAAGDLASEPEISGGLINAGIAIEIATQCDSVDVRMIRGALYLRSLEQKAASMGYSETEIDEYIHDSDEKKRLERLARAQLAQMGAVVGNADSYCAVGQTEISANTEIGRLLR